MKLNLYHDHNTFSFSHSKIFNLGFRNLNIKYIAFYSLFILSKTMEILTL